MTPESPEPTPFEELGEDPRDRAPQPLSVFQSLCGVLGFLVMGLGGAVVVISLLWQERLGRRGATLGLGVCLVGYAIFIQSRKSRRKSPKDW
jgi:hypothetical protein